MPDALKVGLAFAGALGGALLCVPIAIRLAWRTSFLDAPLDYKRHVAPTPYLGGTAVMAAFVPLSLALGGGSSRVLWIVGGAVVMWLVGTIDDRIVLQPLPRLILEAGAGAVLWAAGLGWSAFNSDVAGLALTVFWVVGLINAFNLMDNLDGATGATGAVCAAGAAVLAAIGGDIGLAALAAAMSGACAGFLVPNLSRPSRIFLGDGGSMPIGFVAASVVMASGRGLGGLGAAGVVAAAPLVGLPIIDTTLVLVSRLKRGAPLLAGGRDHITHRLLQLLTTPRRVAMSLATVQAGLCALGVVLLHAGEATVLEVGIGYVSVGAAVILFLDMSPALQPEWNRTPRRPQRMPGRPTAEPPALHETAS